MDLFGIPVLNMLRQRMLWLSERQNVLAENVANANTPGYGAQDVRPLDFAEMLKEADASNGMRVTHAMHIQGGKGRGSGAFEHIDSPDSEASANGNSVVLEEQMIKVSDTQMDYASATSLYRKALGLLRTAVAGAGRA